MPQLDWVVNMLLIASYRAINVARPPTRRYILRLFFRTPPPPPPLYASVLMESSSFITEWLITFLPGVCDKKIYDKTNLDLLLC